MASENKPSTSTNLAMPVSGGINSLNTTGSVLVKTGSGELIGIFVASASDSPTIKLWDQTSAAVPVLVNVFTPIAGTWYPLPFHFNTALYITIGGTLDCTISYT